MWSPILVAVALFEIIQVCQSYQGDEEEDEAPSTYSAPTRVVKAFPYLKINIMGSDRDFAYGTVTWGPHPSLSGNIILWSKPSCWDDEDRDKVYEKLAGKNSEFLNITEYGGKYQYHPFLNIECVVNEEINGVATTREGHQNIYGVTRIEICAEGIIIYFSWKDINAEEQEKRRGSYFHVLKFKDNENMVQVMVGKVNFETKIISVPVLRYTAVLEAFSSVLSNTAPPILLYVSAPILNLWDVETAPISTPMVLREVKLPNKGFNNWEFQFVGLGDSVGL